MKRTYSLFLGISPLFFGRAADAQCGEQLARDCAMATQAACIIQSEHPYNGGANGYMDGVPVWDLLWDPAGGGFFNQQLPGDLLIYGMTLQEYRSLLEEHYQNPAETIDDLLADAVRVCSNRELFTFAFSAYNACVALMCSDCTSSIQNLGGNYGNCLWFEEENRNQCTTFLSHDQCSAMYGQNHLWRQEPDIAPPPAQYHQLGYGGEWSWWYGGGGAGWSGGDGGSGGFGGVGGSGGGGWAYMCTTTDWYTCVSVGGVSYGCHYDYSETSCQWEVMM